MMEEVKNLKHYLLKFPLLLNHGVEGIAVGFLLKYCLIILMN